MATDADASTELDKNAPPQMFPLTAPESPNVAQTKDYRFGWYAPRKKGDVLFVVTRFGAFAEKTVVEHPLTETGWERAWTEMVKLSPELATAVKTTMDRAENYRARVAAGNAMKEERDGLGVLAVIAGCELLGGHGFDPELMVGERCDLYFTSEGIWVTKAQLQRAWIRTPYSAARALEFSGPGRVKKGGGFIGGGFGLVGIAESMVAAALLNSLTTKYSIQTVIRFQAVDLEAFFFCSTATPGDLRIKLSAAVSRIRDVPTDAPTPALEQPEDFTIRLERLGQMFSSGLLSAEEFATAKAKLLGS